MGYFLTTLSERTLGRPPAHPKTHTPGSRVSNLGRRFYSPGLGRWISRDPLAEKARKKSHAPRPSASPDAERYNYLFVRNSPSTSWDYLGLITFINCSDQQQQILSQNISAACQGFLARVDSFKKCLCEKERVWFPNRLASCMRSRCQNWQSYTFECRSDRTGNCSDETENGVTQPTCAWTMPWGTTINVCPAYWTECPLKGCVLLHEIAHQCFRTEDTALAVERCLGCP